MEHPMNLSTLLPSLLFVAACGGSEPAKTDAKPAAKAAEAKPAPKPEPTPQAAPPPAAAPEIVVDDGKVVTVNLTASDAMQFNTNKIEIKAGRTVKLNLKHVGTMAVEMMGHNFVLLASGTDLNAFSAAGVTAKDTEYIAEGFKDKVLAKTKLIGGGASDSIEFAAPPPGEYDFLCTFPGHSAIMKGKLIVS